jgi:hypothetical protein
VLNNRIEDLINRLKSILNTNIELTNVVDVYIEKQKEIISYLKTYGIDYYSEEFTLGKIILNKLEIEIDNCEQELIKAINKCKKKTYIPFINTNILIHVISKNIKNYNNFLYNIKKYNFHHDIDNIIKYKYSNNNNYYLKETANKDKKILNKLGRKDLVNYINNISKK